MIYKYILLALKMTRAADYPSFHEYVTYIIGGGSDSLTSSINTKS